MRFLILTFCFLMASQMTKAECSTTITGPTALCTPGLTAGVYTVNFNNSGWLCGRRMNIRLTPGSGAMTSIITASGTELLNGPTSSFNIQSAVAYPLFVTAVWIATGCQTITATGGDSSVYPWCGCTDTAVLDVMVVAPSPITDIALVTGEPATSCGNITLCATVPSSNCAGGFTWTIKGESLSGSSNGINYFLETCPLGEVSVSRTSGCGSSGTFLKSFTCNQGSANPYIDHEIMACKGRFWSADVPGTNVKVVVLNDSGNTIAQDGNLVSFIPTELRPVVISITFTLCGREFTQTLFIQVVDCGPIIKIIDKDPIQNRQEQKPEADFSSIKAEIYPNPASDILNIQFENSNYTVRIYNLQGQLLKEVDNLENTSKVDISNLPAGAYFITLEEDGNIITKKLTKQ